MNKKKLFPLALVPLAATSLQAQSNIQTGRTDKRPNIILFIDEIHRLPRAAEELLYIAMELSLIHI